MSSQQQESRSAAWVVRGDKVEGPAEGAQVTVVLGQGRTGRMGAARGVEGRGKQLEPRCLLCWSFIHCIL